MTEQHVSIEDLAAYAAGDLDATAAVAVEAHVLLCAECRSDVDAVSAAATALAAVERPVMPEDVAARLDAALAAEDDDAHPVVVPMSTRRRPSFAGIAAVAAGVALVGAMAVPLLRSEGTRDGASTAALDSAEKGATGGTGAAVESRRLDSNLEYTHDNLASTLASALKGAAFRPPGPAPTAMPSAAGAAAPGVPTTSGEAPERAVSDTAVTYGLRQLQTEPGRFAACLSTLTADFPAQARTPVVVDFARYSGGPAIVLAFPTVQRGVVRDDRLDVYVVGPGCGSGPDAQVLDFQRIPRPE